jgi:hypothetical protein
MAAQTMSIPHNNTRNHHAWYEALMPGVWKHFRDNIFCGLVSITPDAAQEILDKRNNANRPLQPRQLKSLTQAIEDGEWLLTGETIIFTRAGNCINGQHRLQSVVNAKKEIETFVIVGTDPSVYVALDQHAKRRAAQVFAGMGEKHTNQLEACLRSLAIFASVGTLRTGGYLVTVADQLELLKKYGRVREFIAESHRQSKESPFPGCTVPATLHYLFDRCDPVAARQFMQAIHQSRIPEGERWVAANTLVRKLIGSSKSRNNSLDAESIFAMTIKAWNSFRTGQELKLVKYVWGETFPEIHGINYDENGLPILTPDEEMS